MLVQSGWITQISENKYELNSKSLSIINEVESLFKARKKQSSTELMGSDFEENIKKYREMFPKIKLPSKKFARSSYKNLEKNFRWFFENYDYDWNTIFKATAYYIQEYQEVNWKFMRTSEYFIRKQETHQTFHSELANYCEMILEGTDDFQEDYFPTRVV